MNPLTARSAAFMIACLALLCGVTSLPGADQRRSVTTLNEGWHFTFATGDEASAWESWPQVDLPHTWNAIDGAQSGKPYRQDTGRYVRLLRIPAEWAGRAIFLTIGAANAKAIVRLDGRLIGEHVTGFTAFTIDLTAFTHAGRDHVLDIAVDNRTNPQYPPLVSDYTFFGGIHRAVTLTATAPTHIGLRDHSSSGVYLVPGEVTRTHAVVTAQVVLERAAGSPTGAVTATVEVLDHQQAVVTTARITPVELPAAGATRVDIPLRIERPRLWNGRKDPYLYQARVRLWNGTTLLDEVVQPLGLRSFSVDPERGFLLNGEPYELHGTSLHQDHAGKGWAIGAAERAIDVALLQELGATCVRLVHYPHAPETLTLLDRAGIVVWSEIPLAYRTGEAPTFELNCQAMTAEMVCQLYNHPSICFWGLFNEVSSLNPDALTLVQAMRNTVAHLDPNRLTTGAAGAIENDAICDVPDVIAFNRYFGWFIPGANLFGPWAESGHKLYPERRIGVAEYGGGGNIDQQQPAQRRSFTSFLGVDPDMGSESFQARLHEQLWPQIRDKPYLWCKISWTLADWASGGIKPPSPWVNDGVGNMGMVTNDRRVKKDVFYWYKANWSTEPVLYITERRITQRQNREFDLRVYSNLPSGLTLTMNGEPIKAKPEILGKRLLWPKLQAPPGRVAITVTSEANGKVFTDVVDWEFPDLLPPNLAPRPEGEPEKKERETPDL